MHSGLRPRFERTQLCSGVVRVLPAPTAGYSELQGPVPTAPLRSARSDRESILERSGRFNREFRLQALLSLERLCKELAARRRIRKPRNKLTKTEVVVAWSCRIVAAVTWLQTLFFKFRRCAGICLYFHQGWA